MCEFRSFLIGKRGEKEYLSRYYRLFFRKVSESQQHFIFIHFDNSAGFIVKRDSYFVNLSVNLFVDSHSVFFFFNL